MRKLIDVLILWCLFCGVAFGQAVNPQNTFANAVNAASPSLWLNFNDPTASFKDQVSGSGFVAPTSSKTNISGLGGNPPRSNDNSQRIAFIAAGSPGAGTINSVTLLFDSAPPIGQVVQFLIGTLGTGTSITINSSTPLTTTSTALTQTFTVSIPIAFGQLEGYWVASGMAPGNNSITSANLYHLDGQASLPSGAQTYSTGSWGVGMSVGISLTYGTVAPQQPGFDSTNPQQYSAAFPWNGFSAAPNNTLGAMEWNVPWTMLVHVDRLNWDRTGTLMLASKGDSSSNNLSWWKLLLQRGPSSSGNGASAKLCFERNGWNGTQQAQQEICTGNYYDAMPNGFNYDIAFEDSGTGQPGALSFFMNGSADSYIPAYSFSNTYAYGFGNVKLAVTAGGTGYAAATRFTSTGGGATCVVTGTASATSGVITSISANTGDTNAGCTSNPTIVLTSPTGTGATFTATSSPMSMNSTTSPLMVPGYVSNGVTYGVGGTDTTQNAVNMDEFAIFPGNLTFGQITGIFNQTKFYQGELYPGIAANPPLVIFETTGCGPDFSGDQTTAMLMGSARAGIIRLLGLDIDDGNANGINSVGWYRQMLDQAGLADVPVSWGGAASITNNTGGCPAANITAFNASTPQNPASYESSTTMFRTMFAKYSTKPIYVLLTQTYNGYAQFLASPADSISSLTGAQLQAQNAANGGWVSFYEGNLSLDPTDRNTIWSTNGAMPIWVPGGFGGEGGPGILVSRIATDPLYMTAATMGAGDAIQGYTNQNLAQVLSPYFNGGLQVATSGGTGYANATSFTTVGGGPYCHAAGIMTAASGVPNGIDTSWGSIFGSTYNGLGYGCTPATFTATGSGTNLTVSNVFGTITVGDTISGTGIPAGTTITGQTSGPTGEAGVYTTSVATTASAAKVTRTPTIVLTSPTGTGVTLTPSLGIFLNAYTADYSPGATNTWTIWPNQYNVNTSTGGAGGASTAPIFSWFTNSLMDGPVNGRPAP